MDRKARQKPDIPSSTHATAPVKRVKPASPRQPPKWSRTQDVTPKAAVFDTISKRSRLFPKPSPHGTTFDAGIKEGQEKLKRAENEWKKDLDQFAAQYGIFAPDKVNLDWLACSNTAVALSERFDRPSHTTSPMPDSLTSGSVPQHVESLLNQAADLFDRCLAAQLEWDDRAAKAATIGLEVLDYTETDKIHQEEIEAGIYTVPYKQSLAEWKAYEATQGGLTDVKKQVDYGGENLWNEERCRWHVYQSSRVAWASGVAAYQTNPPLGSQLRYDYINAVIGAINKQKTVAQHFQEATSQMAEHGFRSEYNQFLIERNNYTADLKATKEREIGWGARAHWDQSDISFRRRRTEVARKLADLRIKMMSKRGCALNYAEQMTAIRRRYERDFHDALGRVAVAAEGLHQLFDYPVPLPASVYVLLNKSSQQAVQKSSSLYAKAATWTGTPQTSILEDAVSWTRDAISWMISFEQLDQTYTRVFSVKELTGALWAQGQATGVWNFDIKEDLLDESHARIRSISIYITGQSSGLWTAQIKVPVATNIRMLDGRLGPSFNQVLPTCRLGRVSHRDPLKAADVGGVSSLHNASPIGEGWQLKLGPRSTADEPLSTISDVHLDIELAARLT